MLDQVHPSLPNSVGDDNTYTLGQINHHNIVIACTPFGTYGSTSAATVATMMLLSFGQVRFGLLVGIGGGVPSQYHDIRLGDVVVSQPNKSSAGMDQYDVGRSLRDGTFQLTGSLINLLYTLVGIIFITGVPHDKG